MADDDESLIKNYERNREVDQEIVDDIAEGDVEELKRDLREDIELNEKIRADLKKRLEEEEKELTILRTEISGITDKLKESLNESDFNILKEKQTKLAEDIKQLEEDISLGEKEIDALEKDKVIDAELRADQKILEKEGLTDKDKLEVLEDMKTTLEKKKKTAEEENK